MTSVERQYSYGGADGASNGAAPAPAPQQQQPAPQQQQQAAPQQSGVVSTSGAESGTNNEVRGGFHDPNGDVAHRKMMLDQALVRNSCDSSAAAAAAAAAASVPGNHLGIHPHLHHHHAAVPPPPGATAAHLATAGNVPVPMDYGSEYFPTAATVSFGFLII